MPEVDLDKIELLRLGTFLYPSGKLVGQFGTRFGHTPRVCVQMYVHTSTAVYVFSCRRCVLLYSCTQYGCTCVLCLSRLMAAMVSTCHARASVCGLCTVCVSLARYPLGVSRSHLTVCVSGCTHLLSVLCGACGRMCCMRGRGGLRARLHTTGLPLPSYRCILGAQQPLEHVNVRG